MFNRSNAPALAIALASCAGTSALAQNLPFALTELADFEIPWALEFLPDGRLLVTEQRGALKLYAPDGAIGEIEGRDDQEDSEESRAISRGKQLLRRLCNRSAARLRRCCRLWHRVNRQQSTVMSNSQMAPGN